jgi:hypothetical protein
MPLAEPGLARQPELAQRRQGDAPVEHAEAVAHDLVEQGAVDGGHDQAGALGLAVDRGQLGEGLVVEVAGALDLEGHQRRKLSV